MTLTRFGFHFSSISYEDVGPAGLVARILEVASAAEAAGFDSLWVPDHVHQNDIGGGPSRPMLEAYTLLGALAIHTREVKLGALVTPVTFRNPATLAKTITTLDVLSGGRAILGLGAGWDAVEHAAYGIAFPGASERWGRLEEAIQLCRALFSSEPVSYTGRFYTAAGAWNAPRPLQPTIPLLIGGAGPRRTLPLVARYADACNFFGDSEALAGALAALRGHCHDAGRDYDEIAKTSFLVAPEDTEELCGAVAGQFAAGIEGVILLSPTCPSPATVSAWGDALRARFT